MKLVKQRPVAIFDIDGTIFRNSLLIELHWKMVKEGLIPRSQIKELDRRYWNWVTRRGSYDDYLQEVIDSFNTYITGVSTKTIQQFARQVVKVQSSIVYRYTRALITKLRKTHLLVAISGSPQIVVGEFARTWGFDYYIGTQHAIHNGKFVPGKIWVAAENKQEALRRLQEQHGFTVGRGSVGVGDTESDIKILELVDVPICLNPTAGLYKVAARRGWLTVVERKDAVYKIKKGRLVGDGR
jgi:HAD superfamily hydrolase (TIGR01490 family)